MLEKKEKYLSCDIREDLESILLRFEDGQLMLSETLELIIGDLSNQIETIIEVLNDMIKSGKSNE